VNTMPAPGAPSPFLRKELALIGLMTVGALLLRVYQLGREELWLDEALSFYTTTGPLDLTRIFRAEFNPPLYGLLLRGWIHWAGSSEAAIRLPSAIFGALFVPAIIWAGTLFFNKQVGFWAGAFAMLAPVHIYYSQEARAYALLAFLLTLTAVLFWRALQFRTVTAWGLATLAAVLTLYTHYFALLALIPMTGMVFLGPHRPWLRQHVRRLAMAMLLCVALYAPLLYWHLLRTHHPASVEFNWVEEFWQHIPPLLAIPRTLEIFWLGSQADQPDVLAKVFPFITVPAPIRILGLLLLGGLLIWVLLPWKDSLMHLPFLQDRKLWLGTMLFFPLATLWLMSFYRAIYALGRYDFVAFPAFCLLIGVAFTKLQAAAKPRGLLLSAAAILFAVVVGTKLTTYYQGSAHPTLGVPSPHKTAQFLMSEVRTGDFVIFSYLRTLPILYYLARNGFDWVDGSCVNEREGRQFWCRIIPLQQETAPATMFDLSHSVGTVIEDLQSILASQYRTGKSIWLVSDRTYQIGIPNEGTIGFWILGRLQILGFQIISTDPLGVVEVAPEPGLMPGICCGAQ
jgi:uncharacterized membrane protein